MTSCDVDKSYYCSCHASGEQWIGGPIWIGRKGGVVSVTVVNPSWVGQITLCCGLIVCWEWKELFLCSNVCGRLMWRVSDADNTALLTFVQDNTIYSNLIKHRSSTFITMPWRRNPGDKIWRIGVSIPVPRACKARTLPIELIPQLRANCEHRILLPIMLDVIIIEISAYASWFWWRCVTLWWTTMAGNTTQSATTDMTTTCCLEIKQQVNWHTYIPQNGKQTMLIHSHCKSKNMQSKCCKYQQHIQKRDAQVSANTQEPTIVAFQFCFRLSPVCDFLMCVCTSHHGRVVKAVDSKSTELCSRRFESCWWRFFEQVIYI